ncbi:MAG: SCO family protein [Candidatus Schekmanbacteria bacterium]|nr:SCO family protein [Candidatus Schekmanbacteria bacterium]
MEPRRLLRNPYFWGLLIGIAGVHLVRPLTRYEPAPPPVLHGVPDFTLSAASGEPFRTSDLNGRVYIAAVVSTACPGACGRVRDALVKLQRGYQHHGADICVLAITATPESDNPAALRRARDAIAADPERWTWLTGPAPRVEALVRGLFALPPDPAGTGDALLLAEQLAGLVLIDRDGLVRGRYASDELGVDEAFHRSRHVASGRGGRKQTRG